MNNISNWIWTGEWQQEYDQVPAAVLFRKKILILQTANIKLELNVLNTNAIITIVCIGNIN